jgi:hypothetical protein
MDAFHQSIYDEGQIFWEEMMVVKSKSCPEEADKIHLNQLD